MALGPGKYDDLCTLVRQRAEAAGAIVIVVGGKLGPGFSMQGDLALLHELPEVLEHLARELRADRERLAARPRQ